MAVGGKRRRPTTREEAFRRAMELNIILSISMCYFLEEERRSSGSVAAVANE